MLAQRDEQIAVVGLRDAAAVMIARRQRPLLAEDDLDLVELASAVVEFGARDRGASTAVGPLGKAEIDGLVLREGFVGDDVEQAALARRPHLGHALERRRDLSFARDDAHAARTLGHQHRAVGQERQRPRIDEAPCDGANLEFARRRAERRRFATRAGGDQERDGKQDRDRQGGGHESDRCLHRSSDRDVDHRAFANDANEKAATIISGSASRWWP